MQDILIQATAETPEVKFLYSANTLSITGESYPENAMAFYAPLRAGLHDYLVQVSEQTPIEAHFSLKYFNSSSTKLLRSLISLLNDAARAGKHITAHWYHDPEDDMMMEFGHDLQDEFGMLHLNVTPFEVA
ncbi:MAG TPA: DUF1987 domain-containing protein [Roseateles sp.]|nr:DUF1987 domain-containing protein [Roseateles sp.]HWT54265.1 DUF1987 domain-containing protein [Rhodocyclaceae bacterium]